MLSGYEPFVNELISIEDFILLLELEDKVVLKNFKVFKRSDLYIKKYNLKDIGIGKTLEINGFNRLIRHKETKDIFKIKQGDITISNRNDFEEIYMIDNCLDVVNKVRKVFKGVLLDSLKTKVEFSYDVSLTEGKVILLEEYLKANNIKFKKRDNKIMELINNDWKN